jgi:hypothetical protein
MLNQQSKPETRLFFFFRAASPSTFTGLSLLLFVISLVFVATTQGDATTIRAKNSQEIFQRQDYLKQPDKTKQL